VDAIQTVNLTKRFKDFVTVDNLNLSIEQGELFALLGVNGAGKPTIIKILSDLLVLFSIVLSNIVLFNYIRN
jgi:ABC-2 type transport system ATP-binding protein